MDIGVFIKNDSLTEISSTAEEVTSQEDLYCDEEESVLSDVLHMITIDGKLLSDIVPDIDGLSYMILSTLSGGGHRITNQGKCKGYRKEE